MKPDELLSTLQAQARRFDEMVYALDAGNLERTDIPAAVFRQWIEYVILGAESAVPDNVLADYVKEQGDADDIQ